MKKPQVLIKNEEILHGVDKLGIKIPARKFQISV